MPLLETREERQNSHLIEIISPFFHAIIRSPLPPFSKARNISSKLKVVPLEANKYRLKKVLYRAPMSDKWEEKDWNWAIERIARLVKSDHRR